MKVTVTFDEVKGKARRDGRCTRCGKKTTRTATFTKTVNPFNTIEEDGVRRPKTYAEVQQDVWREARDWNPDPEVFNHTFNCTEKDA